MDARWVLVILLLPLVSGCIFIEDNDLEDLPDAEEGDLVLTISMGRTNYTVKEIRNRTSGSSIITVDIVLENVCEHSLAVDREFDIGLTLHPKCYAENGTEVMISYPIVKRRVTYEEFGSYHKRTCQFDLLSNDAYLKVDGKLQPFGWDVPGQYNLTVGWWGARNFIEVWSNTLDIQLV